MAKIVEEQEIAALQGPRVVRPAPGSLTDPHHTLRVWIDDQQEVHVAGTQKQVAGGECRVPFRPPTVEHDDGVGVHEITLASLEMHEPVRPAGS